MGLTRYFVGLDLGQLADYTAVAVLELAELRGPWDPVYYEWKKQTILRLRHLERMALGTPYPEVVERVRRVVRSGELLGQCRLMVDATGVGPPVVDMLRRVDLGCPMMPAMITGAELESSASGYYRVPKRDLVVGLQVMLQEGVLEISGGMAEARTLVEEMLAMRVRITPAMHEQYGAWRQGEHDDLVLAVAMAVWGAKKARPDLWGRG